MQSLIDYADRIGPVSAETTGADVYARFQAEPNTLAIAVVDDEGRPIGIVERNAFFLKMAAEFGRALYARRPITFLMDAPRVADARASVMSFMASAISHDPASLLEGFVLVEDGRYAAVGTPLSLLEAAYHAAEQQVSELKQKTVALAQAERRANAASRAKSQFLATMSHEIRTPLNGVLAVAEIIDRKLSQSELRPYVRTIVSSGETLHRLLTDALDLSRAEAGAMEFVEAPLLLHDLFDNLEALWLPMAEQRDLELRLRRAFGQSVIIADVVRLKQILNNLIGNALKFTTQGHVEVRAALNSATSPAALVVEVEDTGPGIPADQMSRIFAPFAKADERDTAGGAGLGLSICRSIVAAMGGTIRVSSEPGRGSVFTVEMPVRLGALEVAAPASADTPPDIGGVRALVVDDNETNRLVATTFLEMFGLAYVVAEDGAQAVEVASREAFDIILMDIKMPVMGGLEATRAIREGDGPNRSTPVLALTANADPKDAKRYRAGGMAGVVEKPLRPDQLLSAIDAVLSDQNDRVMQSA